MASFYARKAAAVMGNTKKDGSKADDNSEIIKYLEEGGVGEGGGALCDPFGIGQTQPTAMGAGETAGNSSGNAGNEETGLRRKRRRPG